MTAELADWVGVQCLNLTKNFIRPLDLMAAENIESQFSRKTSVFHLDVPFIITLNYIINIFPVLHVFIQKSYTIFLLHYLSCVSLCNKEIKYYNYISRR
jgi:hypothetical protein